MIIKSQDQQGLGQALDGVPVADGGFPAPVGATAREAYAPRGGTPNGQTVIPGMAYVTGADLMKSVRKARRECGEQGKRLLILDSWSHFISSKMPPVCDFVTFTWRESKDPLHPKGHYTPKSVFRDVHKLFRDADLQTPSFYVAEPHKWLETLHAHGLIRHLDPTEHDVLFRFAVHRFGRVQILPANPAAFPYVCKYLFKDACCGRHDYIDLSGLRCDL